MEFIVFLKGMFVGFAMAVPIGPIGIMCIRKTLIEGKFQGMIIGLGAATADMLYGCVAAFGLTFISNVLDSQQIWIRLTGGVLFLVIGIRAIRTRKVKTEPFIKRNKGLSSYISTIFLTLTNPLTLFSFIAFFAALSLGKGLNYFSASALVTGVSFGSFLWFMLLISGVALFRKKFNLIGLKWLNKISGILIIISGIVAIISAL